MWVLPSLDRPHLLKRFFDSYKTTEGSTKGLVLVDKTDPKKEEYLKLEYPEGWTLVLTDAILMGDKVREAWDQIIQDEWVGILNDDHICQTKHWDKLVIEKINGKNVVGTNDGPTPDKPWNAPNRICGAIAFSAPILKALGWMFPPGLQHLYSDDVWGYLFGQAKCCQILMEVCVEHRHVYNNPEAKDSTFEKVNGNAKITDAEPHGGLWDSDRQAFQRWLKEDSQKDLQKVIALQPKEGVMIATPSHDGNVAFAYALGLADAGIHLSIHGWHFEMARVVGSSLIPHARNTLVDIFLKSRCQKLLFVDSDQGWTKDHLIRLLGTNKRIVAGVTPHKRFPINLNFDPLEDHKHHFQDLNNKSQEEFYKFVKKEADPTGEIEVSRTGTGFVMVDRSVFEIMKDHVPHYLAYDNNDQEKHGEYFAMGGDGERFRGEDWKFCELAKKLKIPIFINSNVILSHQGSYTFMIDESLRGA